MCFLRYDEELANNDQAGQDLKAKAGVPTTTRGGAAAGKKFSSTWKWENSRLGETFAWRPHTGMPDLGRKWVRLAPNGTNQDLSKSPAFVPFGAHLTYFAPKSDICALMCVLSEHFTWIICHESWCTCTCFFVKMPCCYLLISMYRPSWLFYIYLRIKIVLWNLICFCFKSMYF